MQMLVREMVKAMKRIEVIGKAMSGQLKWYQAAEILDVSPRQLRRIAARWKEQGEQGLFDKRRCGPSPRHANASEVELVRQLYRDRYFDFNVQHFHEMMCEYHGLRRSYTWTKNVLQDNGLVVRAKKRGQHRRRRPRRPMVGMMMHLDASTHQWFGADGKHMDLLAVLDDANSEVYALHLVEQESTESCMSILRQVVEIKGIFGELYTDRASHFCFTPEAGKGPDKSVKTQLGRAMEQLEIKMIFGRSPQARGRGERLWETIQGRLPQELRVAGITTAPEAQAYITKRFLPRLNAVVMQDAAEQTSAFVPATAIDLDRVFCLREDRTVDNDNTVRFQNKRLQIPKNNQRATFVGCVVKVELLLNGKISIWYGHHLLGRYNADGCLQPTSVKYAPPAQAEAR